MSFSDETNSAAEMQIEKEMQQQTFRKSFIDEEKKQKGFVKLQMYHEFTLGFFTGLILNVVGLLVSLCVSSKHFKEGTIAGFIYFMFFAILSTIGVLLYNYALLY